MQYSSPSEYLKQLKMQQYYCKKFRTNYANHNDLTKYCTMYLNALENEIDIVENNIAIYKMKKKFSNKEYKGQVSIYDFVEVDKC